MGGRGRIINLRSPEQTAVLGQRAAEILPAGAILALHGPLGAGKTSFVQGLATGLKIETPVQSPTFTYLNLYEGGNLCLYHFDLYRMNGASDFLAMGFEEYFDCGGITAIEWPERLGSLLPSRAFSFFFSYSGYERTVHLSSSFASELVESLLKWD